MQEFVFLVGLGCELVGFEGVEMFSLSCLFVVLLDEPNIGFVDAQSVAEFRSSVVLPVLLHPSEILFILNLLTAQTTQWTIEQHSNQPKCDYGDYHLYFHNITIDPVSYDHISITWIFSSSPSSPPSSQQILSWQ